jgi:hypothetical protein
VLKNTGQQSSRRYKRVEADALTSSIDARRGECELIAPARLRLDDVGASRVAGVDVVRRRL